MRCWSAVTAAGGQLQVRAGAGHGEEDAVVAAVVAEATDLGQPDAVSVEPTTCWRRSVCRATHSCIAGSFAFAPPGRRPT
jgi:hypothetical protein